jgi:hypothetical protein
VKRRWRISVAVGVVVLVGVVAYQRLSSQTPSVVVSDAQSRVSIPTGSCIAPDIQGPIQGAQNCLRSTFALVPIKRLAAMPGERITFALSGDRYDYGVLRVRGGSRCMRSEMISFRPHPGVPVGWSAPRSPGVWTIRIVFNSVGTHGTATTLVGVHVGSPSPRSRSGYCPD